MIVHYCFNNLQVGHKYLYMWPTHIVYYKVYFICDFCKGLHLIFSVTIYKVYTIQQLVFYALEPSTVNLCIQINKSKSVRTLLTCCRSRTKFKVLGRDSRSLCVVSLRGEFRIRGMIGGWGGGGSHKRRDQITSAGITKFRSSLLETNAQD